MSMPNDNHENKKIYSLSIPVQVDYDEILNKIYPNRLPPKDDSLKTIILESQTISHPQAVFRLAWIESIESEGIVIDRVRFESPLLSKTLHRTCLVFPYIITLSQKFDDKISAAGSLLEQFYLDQIGNLLLRKCGVYLESHLKYLYNIKQLSSISPGSLADWPIEGQKPLFSLLGETQRLIGVSLTPQMLMIPKKTISGLFFPTKEKFIACSLCSRKDCPEREAPYLY
jgi:hypothetical protein